MEEAVIRGEADEADQDAPGREHEQRHGHHARRLVGVVEQVPVARFAVEGEPDRAGDVERRQPAGEYADDPEERVAVRERGAEDLVLRPEPGQRRERRERAAGDDHRPVRDRHLRAQAAHPPHVLDVGDAVDHRPGSQEQESLEERVGDEVEHGRDRRPDSESEEHVAELADRRVRHHALDVELHERDGGGEDRGERAHAAHSGEDRPRRIEQRRRSGDQVHAGGHHRRRVDEGRDRGRALHRIR